MGFFFFIQKAWIQIHKCYKEEKSQINITRKKKKKFDEHFPIFTLLAGFVNLFTL